MSLIPLREGLRAASLSYTTGDMHTMGSTKYFNYRISSAASCLLGKIRVINYKHSFPTKFIAWGLNLSIGSWYHSTQYSISVCMYIELTDAGSKKLS